MTNILEEAQSVVEKADHKQMCERCTWNNFCIKPPTMTTEEVEERLEELPPDTKGDSDVAYFKVFNAVIFGGRDKACDACPVFISRLREGPRLSQEIRRIMQGWDDDTA